MVRCIFCKYSSLLASPSTMGPCISMISNALLFSMSITFSNSVHLHEMPEIRTNVSLSYAPRTALAHWEVKRRHGPRRSEPLPDSHAHLAIFCSQGRVYQGKC